MNSCLLLDNHWYFPKVSKFALYGHSQQRLPNTIIIGLDSGKWTWWQGDKMGRVGKVWAGASCCLVGNADHQRSKFSFTFNVGKHLYNIFATPLTCVLVAE